MRRRGYSWPAAHERWPEHSHRRLYDLLRQARAHERTLAESGRGQPARRLGGIDPSEMFQPSEAWLTPDEAFRECGIGAVESHF